MKIGITGGAGFIGSHVIEEAIGRGHSVLVFDHHGRIDRTIAAKYAEYDHVTAMLGDVRNPVAMAELAAHTDGIIHLAACLGTQETIQNPRPAFATNIEGGLNFLEACTQYGIPGVNIGVGNWFMNNSYAISKHAVERTVSMFNTERGARVNTVRLVNAYGPRQSVAAPYGAAKVRKITPAFICRALTGAPIEVYGDGLQVSDMVHVRDGAHALVVALEKAAEGIVFDKPVEVGSAFPVTVLDVAREVQAAAHEFGFPQHQGVVHLPMRPGEVPGAVVKADITTLARLDMDPSYLTKLSDGIMDTVRWYAENWLPGWAMRNAQPVGQHHR